MTGSPPRRSTGTLAALAIGALLALAVAACSIQGDDQPRALSISTTTTEEAAVPTSGGASAVLYYTRDGKLVPVGRSLPDRRVSTVLEALMEPPDPVERFSGFATSIPTGTELLGLETDGDTLVIDLSSEFENVVGPSRQQAIAQMVLTATELPAITSVRFEVDGKPVQVTSPVRGDTSTVTDCDYVGLLPSTAEAAAAGLDPTTADRLDARREELTQRCASTRS